MNGNQPDEFGPQSKLGILRKQGLSPLVVSVPAAAAMIGLSENSALPVFEEHKVPVLPLGPTRRVIRISDLDRLLEVIAREVL